MYSQQACTENRTDSVLNSVEHKENFKAPAISLRPYQKDAVSAALNDWRNGIKKILEVLPTGAGKTIVFA